MQDEVRSAALVAEYLRSGEYLQLRAEAGYLLAEVPGQVAIERMTPSDPLRQDSCHPV